MKKNIFMYGIKKHIGNIVNGDKEAFKTRKKYGFIELPIL